MLTLRHASKRISGQWSDDDWDVLDESGKEIGRIILDRSMVSRPTPWFWGNNRIPNTGNDKGYEPTREMAMKAFKRAWMGASTTTT
jgi:hypothetical protein